MSTNNTSEGNRIIAEFMEIPKCERCGDLNCGQYKFGAGNYSHPEIMQYHISWDWLMPVVEKICRMRTPGQEFPFNNYFRTFGMIDIEEGQIMVRFNLMGLHFADTLIEATYTAALEFINWYNSQQNDPNGKV